MAARIFYQIPGLVWLLLITLIVLGVKQFRTHRQSLRRGILVPSVMTALSLFSVISSPAAGAGAILVWAIGLAASAGLALKLGAWRGISWSAQEQLLTVPGSRIPLLLFLGIFSVKFLAGMSLAILPELRDAAGFAMATSLSYGAFSGLFLARGLAMWRATRESTALLATI